MAKERLPSSADFEPPKYLASLIAAINDGAKAAQAGLLLYLLVGIYLLATAFSSTDEDLLLGKTVTIAQIGASLPVSFSFAIAPLIFVFLHVYTLTRYDMLGVNLRHFVSELRASVPSRWDRERCRQLLTNTEFVQALTAPRESPLYNRTWKVMIFLLMAALPVTILLMVQINSLRYQSALILAVQRAWLVADLLAQVWFFSRNPLAHDVMQSRAQRLRRRDRLVILPSAVLLLAFAWVRIVPADADRHIVRYEHDSGPRAFMGQDALLDRLYASLNPPVRDYAALMSVAIGQPLDVLTCPWLGWGCRFLRVERRTLVAHVWHDEAMGDLRADGTDRNKALDSIEGVELPGRTLRFAVLTEGRLYGADMVGADLRGADLRDVDLSGAKLSGADLTNANLRDARLSGADLQDAQLVNANLEGVNLAGAQLTNADLGNAQLAAADLHGAQMDDADLSSAQLIGADLRGTQLANAQLNDASLVGADLSGAQIPGADLSGARLTGIDLRNASAASLVTDGNTLLSLADIRGARIIQLSRADQIRNGGGGMFVPLRRTRPGASETAVFDRPKPVWPLRFKASLEMPVLVSDESVQAFARHPDWLITVPDERYRRRLANFLVGFVAALSPDVANAIALRARRLLNSSDDQIIGAAIACSLLVASDEDLRRVDLAQSARRELTAALENVRQTCPSPTSAAKQP